MNKKTLIVILAIVFLAGVIFVAVRDKKNTEEKVQNTGTGSEMIFFYGQGCPHCENVEKFLEENKSVEEKVKFEKKEVWGDKKNTQLMIEKAKACGMSGDDLPVPFFWDGSDCIVGDIDIINFLKDKAGVQQ